MVRFSVNGVQHLVVANFQSGSAPQIYQWDGSSFVDFHAIPTIAAQAWEPFVIDGVPYLAVANSLDSADNDYLDSKVYKWSEVGGGGVFCRSAEHSND